MTTCPTCTRPFDDRVNPSVAARLLGVSRQSIYKWIKSGKLERDEDGITTESIEVAKGERE